MGADDASLAWRSPAEPDVHRLGGIRPSLARSVGTSFWMLPVAEATAANSDEQREHETFERKHEGSLLRLMSDKTPIFLTETLYNQPSNDVLIRSPDARRINTTKTFRQASSTSCR
jgi:hypothetical protein